MAVVRKKQDDKNLQILRELVTSSPGNRQCFDCGQKGPTYINMTIGSFVCTRCSGVLRGLTPPHRVKSISMATFSPDELDFLKSHGNEECAKTWLGLWDPKRNVHQDQRELIVDKYERKRYFLEPGSPLKSLTTSTNYNSLKNVYNPNNNSTSSITLTPPSSRGSHSSLNGSLNGNSTKITNGFHRQNDDSFTTSAVNGLSSFVNRPNRTKNNSMSEVTQNGSTPSSNGFSSDSDFVADFGSASIFDATKITSPPMLNGKNIQKQNGVNGNENFADFDHAPIYNAAESYQCNKSNYFTTNQNYFTNSQSTVNGQIYSNNKTPTTTVQSNDHPLFPKCNISNFKNSNGQINWISSNCHSINNSNNNNNNIFNSTSNNGCSSSGGSIPYFQTHSQSQLSSSSFYNGTSVNEPNNMWNQQMQWQQDVVQWPNTNGIESVAATPTTVKANHRNNNYVNVPFEPTTTAATTTTTAVQQNANNNWSLPSANTSLNASLNSSLNNNHNTSTASTTPSMDRYAALKDLDEQLRESKAAAAHAATVVATNVVESLNGGVNGNGGNIGSPNPFKAQPPQPQLTPQSQATANPFQTTATIQIFPSQMFGQPQPQQNQQMFNGFSTSNQNYVNFTNGFSASPMANGNTINGNSFGPNGCGFGFGAMHQQQIAVSGGSNFSNPFATAVNSGNSNNPFL